MMSLHFLLTSELSGAIAKRLPHAKNQLSVPGSFFNQFVTDIYIYIYIPALSNRRPAALLCAAHVASKMPLSIPIPSARPCIAARSKYSWTALIYTIYSGIRLLATPLLAILLY